MPPNPHPVDKRARVRAMRRSWEATNADDLPLQKSGNTHRKQRKGQITVKIETQSVSIARP
jgi:hypothetical protein